MEEKKVRKRIPKESKVRAELQKEINSCCPFCSNDDVGHFEIHHIDENPSNNEIKNLILLCPLCHSKITKGDISNFDVLKRKFELVTTPLNIDKQDKNSINFNAKVGNAIIGDNNKVTIKKPAKMPKAKYPEGCIGYDTTKANYIGHLIKRYNEYKEYEIGKDGMNYGAFGAVLKREFKIAPTRTIYNVPIERFEELSFYIQGRIDKTKLARVKGREHKNYSTFEEYKADVG
ncbi:hypothetical protein J2810_002604 [Chryseobacterium rhizosphaerae]|uniref:HNH endonuclease signature motif containing protein n=1 Tax=Chryseobacterium rhizosphaerae TaxID=395937 RepID=UPI0028580554|nr:HNH endonuclease [Chryseobacterium rhizosphaerae]MDR6546545.1 hypothetical protein [Chryseobacterium rhizosphaerae]